MKYLQNQGHEVEIIDYKPLYLSTRMELFAVTPKWRSRRLAVRVAYLVAKFFVRIWVNARSCKKEFDDFKNTFMCVTRDRYRNNSELKKNPPPADVYVAGSDQIWNTNSENGRDPAFYLDFAPPEIRRVSYAASFSVSEIMPEYKDFVRGMIQRLDSVSVRERRGVEILKSIGLSEGVHVLDPVFLLGRSFWDGFSGKKISGKYILVYDFDGNDGLREFAKEQAKERGLKIYSVNNYKRTSYADVDYYRAGPQEFLSLVKNAEVVVGNSFHALAFSLIFEKDFYVFCRSRHQVNSRMEDLLDLVGLSDRMICHAEQASSPSVIDYEVVGKVLAAHIEQSKRYLNGAICGDF
ncbi:polysaccharide pyruvyl transferase family protein [Tichowtungia aerotolerans]|uniref:Polysaccharide pyruvyl transferase family protein n=2 Tax=Tichowtungia aerotolerans TaxID=2697043 RepID=A0A6P1MEY9_9BACT|nr:polysaccharide pyruvyl transferase family protein [Tichowtungia aerotolerans]